MKLLIVGAAGRTGKRVVEQAVKRGHRVTALTRQPDKLKAIQGLERIVEGNALDYETLRSVLAGQDAVIASFGGSQLAHVLTTAMRETGVRRVLMTSSRSVVATRPKFWVGLAWLVFRAAYADLARAEGALEVSGLDWSIVRATMLTDKPGAGTVHLDFEVNATGGDWTLPRADYAMTLLDIAENPAMIGKAVGVGGAKPSKQDTKVVA